MKSYGNSQALDLMDMGRLFMQKGLAIEPVLIQGLGEGTKVILQDDLIILSCTTQRFLHQLCQTQFFNLKSLQDQVKKTIGKKQLVPIPLTFRTVVFPLRGFNKEKVKTRGFLWIVHRHIKKMEVGPVSHQSQLTLTNGHQLMVPYTTSFIHQQIRDSYLLEYFFQEAHASFSPQHGPTISCNVSKETLHEQLLRIAEEIRNYP